MAKHNTNWQEAAYWALQIELQNYSDFLEFSPQYSPTGKPPHLDYCIIRKTSSALIPLEIALHFATYNLFCVKTIGVPITVDFYYKACGYACNYISRIGRKNEFSRQDITLNFLCMYFPSQLIQHLIQQCGLKIEKNAPGIYYLSNDIFSTQFIITKELSPDTYLFLRYLCRQTDDARIISRLSHEYQKKRRHVIYQNYFMQFSETNSPIRHLSSITK